MKKIFLLMFAIMAMTSMQAQNVNVQELKSSRAQEFKGSRVQGVKSSARKTTSLNSQLPTFNHPAKAAAKETKVYDPIDIESSKFAYYYYDRTENHNDLFMSCYSNMTDEYGMLIFKFDFWVPDTVSNPSGHYEGLSKIYAKGKLVEQYSRWVPVYITDGRTETEAQVFYKEASLDLVVKDDGEKSLTGYVVDTNGQKFNINIHQAAPLKPKYEMTLDGIECTTEWSYLSSQTSLFAGTYTDEKAQKEYYVQVCVDGLEGEYGEGEVDPSYTAVFWDVENQKGAGILEQESAKVKYDEKTRTYTVDCSFVGNTENAEDDVYTRYNIKNMTFTLPEVTDTTKIAFTNAEFQSMWGYSMASASNDDYTVQVSYGSVDEKGDIDMSQFNSSLTYKVDGKETGCTSLFSYKGHVEYDANGKPVITAVFYGNDYNMYSVDLRFVMPEKSETQTLALTDCEYTNALVGSQAQRIVAYNADKSFCFSFITYGTDTCIGKWNIEKGEMQAQVYDMKKDRAFKVYTGSLSIEMNPVDSMLTCTGTFFCENTIEYVLTMNVKWKEYEYEKLEYDATDKEKDAVNVSFSHDDVTFLVYNSDEDSFSLNAWNKERNDVVAMGIMAMKDYDGLVIPLGTYPIKNTYALGTVTACPGAEDGVLYPSYYAKKSADGSSLVTPLWQWVDGTVVIDKDTEGKQLVITVDALNSYKVPVHITITFNPNKISGIEEVKGVQENNGSKVQKILENGRIYIVKGGKTYNVDGTRKE